MNVDILLCLLLNEGKGGVVNMHSGTPKSEEGKYLLISRKKSLRFSLCSVRTGLSSFFAVSGALTACFGLCGA